MQRGTRAAPLPLDAWSDHAAVLGAPHGKGSPAQCLRAADVPLDTHGTRPPAPAVDGSRQSKRARGRRHRRRPPRLERRPSAPRARDSAAVPSFPTRTRVCSAPTTRGCTQRFRLAQPRSLQLEFGARISESRQTGLQAEVRSAMRSKWQRPRASPSEVSSSLLPPHAYRSPAGCEISASPSRTPR